MVYFSEMANEDLNEIILQQDLINIFQEPKEYVYDWSFNDPQLYFLLENEEDLIFQAIQDNLYLDSFKSPPGYISIDSAPEEMQAKTDVILFVTNTLIRSENYVEWIKIIKAKE